MSETAARPEASEVDARGATAPAVMPEEEFAAASATVPELPSAEAADLAPVLEKATLSDPEVETDAEEVAKFDERPEDTSDEMSAESAPEPPVSTEVTVVSPDTQPLDSPAELVAAEASEVSEAGEEIGFEAPAPEAEGSAPEAPVVAVAETSPDMTAGAEDEIPTAKPDESSGVLAVAVGGAEVASAAEEAVADAEPSAPAKSEASPPLEEDTGSPAEPVPATADLESAEFATVAASAGETAPAPLTSMHAKVESRPTAAETETLKAPNPPTAAVATPTPVPAVEEGSDEGRQLAIVFAFVTGAALLLGLFAWVRRRGTAS